MQPDDPKAEDDSIAHRNRAITAFLPEFLEGNLDQLGMFENSAMDELSLQVPNSLTGEGILAVSLRFQSLEDFSNLAVISQVEALEKLSSIRSAFRELRGETPIAVMIEVILDDDELYEFALVRSIMGCRESDRRRLFEEIEERLTYEQSAMWIFAKQQLGPADISYAVQSLAYVRDLSSHSTTDRPRNDRTCRYRETLEAIGKELDRRISAQLDLILCNPKFQLLERKWREMRQG